MRTHAIQTHAMRPAKPAPLTTRGTTIISAAASQVSFLLQELGVPASTIHHALWVRMTAMPMLIVWTLSTVTSAFAESPTLELDGSVLLEVAVKSEIAMEEVPHVDA